MSRQSRRKPKDGYTVARVAAAVMPIKDVQELPAGEAAALLPATVLEDYGEAGDSEGVEGE